MRVWRVSRHRELNGIGGLLAAGRWHSQGHPIIYTSEQQATAQLEWLAHLELSSPDEYPVTIPFTEVEIPDNASVRRVRREDLPSKWVTDNLFTRAIGDRWLVQSESALLLVPSVLVPAYNVLINPLHPEAASIAVVDSFDFPLDQRLV